MTIDQARQLIQRYRCFLKFVPKFEFPAGLPEPTPNEALGHIHSLLDEMERFLDQTEHCHFPGLPIEPGWSWDRFERSLGFVQATLWIHGNLTLDELEHRSENAG